MSRFAKRVDATPLAEITSRELRLRLAMLDDELERLAADEAHVRDSFVGASDFSAKERTDMGAEDLVAAISPRAQHLRAIAKERAAAKALQVRYVEELARRTP